MFPQSSVLAACRTRTAAVYKAYPLGHESFVGRSESQYRLCYRGAQISMELQLLSTAQLKHVPLLKTVTATNKSLFARSQEQRFVSRSCSNVLCPSRRHELPEPSLPSSGLLRSVRWLDTEGLSMAPIFWFFLLSFFIIRLLDPWRRER